MPDLRDRLLELQRNGGKPSKPCTVSSYLSELDQECREGDPKNDVADIFRVLIEDSQVGIKKIRDEMNGLVVNRKTPAWTSMKSHRDATCGCGRTK